MKVTVKRFLKEPLIYFLLIGGGFFIAFDYYGPSFVGEQQTIVVDRTSLLRFMQQKTKAVDQAKLIRSFDGLSSDKRQKLIDAYVREQALYRESKALGLAKGDPIIKARAIQNLEFITQDYSEAATRVTDKQLETYFAKNKESYYVEPFVTFTHVFFDRKSNGNDNAKNLAVKKLTELNNSTVSFSEGIGHGNRFPYHVNYVERTPDFVASHFGKAMTDNIFSIPFAKDSSDSQKWQGPFESPYGYHLVMLSRHEQGRTPALVDVSGQVYQDAQRVQIRETLDKTYQAIIDTYHVEISDDVTANTTGPSLASDNTTKITATFSMKQESK